MNITFNFATNSFFFAVTKYLVSKLARTITPFSTSSFVNVSKYSISISLTLDHSCANKTYTFSVNFLSIDAKAAALKFACASMSFGNSELMFKLLLYPCKTINVDHFNARYAVKAVFRLKNILLITYKNIALIL